MAFVDFSGNFQEILLFNYESKGKIFILGILWIFSLVYLFYWKPHVQKKTLFMSIAFLRVLILAYTSASLLFSPMFIFFLSPEYSLWSFFLIFLVFYGSTLTIFLMVLVVDFLKNGVLGIAELGGLETYSESAKKVAKDIKENKYLNLKW